MFGFSRRRIKLGRVKSHLSDSAHGTRSPIRQSKRSNQSAGESAGQQIVNAEDPNCPSSSSSGTDANVSAASNAENWMALSISGERPPPRSNHAAAVVGRKMFVVGGETARGLLLEDVQVLDFDKLTWSAASPKFYMSPSTLPLKIPACKGHCLVPWGQKLLLIGGKTNPPSERITVWAFNVETECWSHVEAKGVAPVARSGHTVTRSGVRFILFGGEDGKGRKLNDLHMFDLKSLTWLPLHCTGTGPSPRCNHVAALYDDKVLMIFGGAAKSKISNDLYSLDFETMAWSKIKTRGFHPTPRAGSCGILSGHKWYIIGGGSRKKRLAETIIFDILKVEWTTYAVATSSSLITNKGFSLVQMMQKERSFLIAFGGTKKESSNQVEVLMINNNDDLQAVKDNDPLISKKSSGSARDFASHLATGVSASLTSSARITDGVEHHGSGWRSLSGSSLDATSNISLQKKFLHEEGPPSGRKIRSILEDDTSKDPTDVTAVNAVKSKVKEHRSPPFDVGVKTDTALGADNTIMFQKKLSANTTHDIGVVHVEPDQTKFAKAPSNTYNHYEGKIQLLEQKNSLLEDQLVTALANQDIAEKNLSSAVRSRQEAEKRFVEAMKETEHLRDKLATVEVAREEANALSNIVHSDNVRLEHDVAFLKAVLDDTQKELHSTRGVLAGERARAFQLQVEVFHLKQRLQAVDNNRAPTPRKPYHA